MTYQPLEWKTFTDSESGATVHQLTDYLAHSHHLYFTNPGWYDGGRRLLFVSDRDNDTNLFSIDLIDGGAITQVTHFDRAIYSRGFHDVCVDPNANVAYGWVGGQLLSIDLMGGGRRPLADLPQGFAQLMCNVTADGKWVCTGYYDAGVAALGFEEKYAARPLSRIIRVRTDTGDVEVLHEENVLIGHINTSPTQPHLMTYCHEGPWTKVENRIWCMDMARGESWKVRPRESGHPDECVGHEYWMADGLRIGYHGHCPRQADGDCEPVFGCIRYDNTEQIEVPFPAGSKHFHSLDEQLIVGDGRPDNPRILLWRREGEGYDGPYVLARHDGSWRTQALHVHPRISPDRRFVLYTADPENYGNVYLAALPDDINRLPRLGQ